LKCPRVVRNRFDRLADAAGPSRITFYDLRHSYATGPLETGVSPKVLSRHDIHKSIQKCHENGLGASFTR